MKRRTTVYIEDGVLREVRVEAAIERCSFSDILEEALRNRRRGGGGRREAPWARRSSRAR
jgi:hypothetical protein